MFPLPRIQRAVAACAARMCAIVADGGGGAQEGEVSERDATEAVWAAAVVRQQLPPDQVGALRLNLDPSDSCFACGACLVRSLYSGACSTLECCIWLLVGPLWLEPPACWAGAAAVCTIAFVIPICSSEALR